MQKITVKWMWGSKYGDFEGGENTIDVPEETAAKDKVLEFFRSPDFSYNDAGAHVHDGGMYADSVNFNAYRAPASGTEPGFLFSGTYVYNEIEWDNREIPLDL